jgi:AcrR family transcriptional regulator
VSKVLTASRRRPLNRERVLRAAIELVDRQGLGALTMRRLGSELGVEAMSLYKHFRGKEDICAGMVDLVAGEITLPPTPDDATGWVEVLDVRARSSKEIFSRHPWAIGLMESRRVLGPNLLRSLDATLGGLRSAGFTIDDAAHVVWLVDSFVYGHVISAVSRGDVGPDDDADPLDVLSSSGFVHLADLGRHALESPFTLDDEFERGLAAILHGVAWERTQGG